MSTFGERFSELFGGKKQREIAETLGVTDAAVRNYLGGRVPDADKLQLIADVTGCNLHWLLTGDGEQFRREEERFVRKADSFDRLLEDRIRSIVMEVLENTMTAAPVQDLGTIDEFDLAVAIRTTDDPGAVMNAWYAHDGLDAPEGIQGLAFSGWDKMTLEEKVQEIRGARSLADHLRNFHDAARKSKDTSEVR